MVNPVSVTNTRKQLQLLLLIIGHRWEWGLSPTCFPKPHGRFSSFFQLSLLSGIIKHLHWKNVNLENVYSTHQENIRDKNPPWISQNIGSSASPLDRVTSTPPKQDEKIHCKFTWSVTNSVSCSFKCPSKSFSIIFSIVWRKEMRNMGQFHLCLSDLGMLSTKLAP